jgi:hypothetical protein
MQAAARLRDATPRTRVGFAVVTALFAFAGIRGFAASLGSSAGGLGAGDAVVASCGVGLTFAYTTAFDNGGGGYAVNGINLSNIPPGCLRKSLSVRFDDSGDNAVGSAVNVILPASGTTESVSIHPSSNIIEASQISGVSVVVS